MIFLYLYLCQRREVRKKTFTILFFTILNYSNAVLAWTPVIDDIKKVGKDVTREAQNCLSGGCDPGEIAKKGLKSGFSAAAEGAAEEVEESIIRSIDHIFDNQVDPLLERVGVLSKEVINQGGAEAEERAKNIINYAVKDIVEGFNPWIQEAARMADRFSPEELEEHLIKTSFDRLDQLEKKLFQDANLVIDRVAVKIDGTVDKVDCAIEGQRRDLRNDIVERLLRLIETPSTKEKVCAEEHDLKITFNPFSDRTSIRNARNDELYDFNKCIIKKDITFNTKTDKILARYSALAGLAAEYRCIERRGDPDRYTRDWLYFRERAQIWKKAHWE